jgi:hypothetical protein
MGVIWIARSGGLFGAAQRQPVTHLSPKNLGVGLKFRLGRGRRSIGGGLQRGLGLAHVETTEAAFDESATRGEDFFVQAVIVPAQHNGAAMCDDYGVGCLSRIAAA